MNALPVELLAEATAHASWAPSREVSYDRLAFVGDSLLAGMVTLHLDSTCPREEFPPGVLSRIRASVVSDETLRAVAARIGLDSLAVANAPGDAAVQASEIVATGKPLASMMEAVIAACWQHHGATATSAAVIGELLPAIAEATAAPVEAKSMLQELLARQGSTVRYETVRSGGTEHAPEFRSDAIREPGEALLGSGEGPSKKAAESEAARVAIEALEEGG